MQAGVWHCHRQNPGIPAVRSGQTARTGKPDAGLLLCLLPDTGSICNRRLIFFVRTRLRREKAESILVSQLLSGEGCCRQGLYGDTKGRGILSVPRPVFVLPYKKGGTLKDSGAKMPVDVLPYLAANDYLPSDNPKVKALAEKTVKGKKGTLARARAVYDWTIANTHRDNSVKGCGLGQAIRTLTEANGGGKCADISSVFITVARAAGIPARDVFGLRTKGKDGAITGDFHCWAEFYLPGTGWVQVDPADVRKAMLNEKLGLGDQATKKYTEFFWNGDDLFRIALNRGEHGALFNGMKAEPVGYFMYPYAEVDGKALDYFDPKNFEFAVSFKAD